MSSAIRNIVILAHADAGKTSLTEQFLFLGGKTRRPGSVDQGTTQTDFLPVEKERGISVRSAHTSYVWNGIHINLIDTPGHVDFSSDVERALRAADGVILVLSAVEGVQAHTETLWTALRERGLPVIFFINKIDRMGADTEAVVRTIVQELKVRPLCLQEVSGEGENTVSVTSRWEENDPDGELLEAVVAGDDGLLTAYLEEGTVAFRAAEEQLSRLARAGTAFPLLFGSAKLGMGINELLEAVERYLPPPAGDPAKPLSAVVFGIGHDKIAGRIAHVRIFDGTLANRDTLYNATRGEEEKATQVRRILPGRYEESGKVLAGDIAGVGGLESAQVGDILCAGNREVGMATETIPPAVTVRTPLITVRVRAVSPKELTLLAEALRELDREDPALGFEWLRDESELNVQVMGWMQMEVLERILYDRFGIEARFENPTVIYKETPAAAAEGFVRYWMPKPCWAILKFLIEPGERGSGVVYQSLVPVNSVQQKYQNEVERTISTALKQGIKGWEVTDVRITLLEGEDHPVHSRPGDFVIATPMGIHDGLARAGTTLLEPINAFRITAPDELLGVVTADILALRGSFDSPVMDDGRFTLTGTLPLATSLDFPVKLSSRSGGKARVATRFLGYAPCSDEQGVVRSYRGISPLETAKYILKARGALQ